MTLFVCVEGTVPPWLTYTLDTINALFKLQPRLVAIPLADLPTGQPHASYTAAPHANGSAWLPRRDALSGFTTRHVDVEWDSGRSIAAPIYRDTVTMEPGSHVFTFDVLYNIFANLSCLEEFSHEQRHGPIHSYASRLIADRTRYDRPYAHYMARAFVHFLKRNVVPELNIEIPRPGLFLTHDIDVGRSSVLTGAKESAFRLFNAVRRIRRGDMRRAVAGLREALRPLLTPGRRDPIETIARIESAEGYGSSFYVYAGTPSLRSAIFDPPYRLSRERWIAPALSALDTAQHEIGIHFGYDTWRDSSRMMDERHRLASCLGTTVAGSCRQHWFRFSLSETWRAQIEAGILHDLTIGFTDRPGFRTGLAAPFRPYDHERNCAFDLVSIPNILMDTHLFNYADASADERRRAIDGLLDDLADLGGQSAIIWHSHVFGGIFGWESDYNYLLHQMRSRGFTSLLPRAFSAA